LESRALFKRGFAVVVPTKDRDFYFAPNQGESSDFHPHYGLHVLDVDHLTNSLQDFAHFQASNHPAKSYDFGNITDMKRLKHSSIEIEENIHVVLEAIDNNTSGDVRADCRLIYYNLVENGTSTLSDIYFLFHHVGFSKIYLIDPSCRAFSNPTSRYATLRPKTDTVVQSPPLYSSQEPLLFTQESDESIAHSHCSYEPYQPDTQTSNDSSLGFDSPRDDGPNAKVTGWLARLQSVFNTSRPIRRLRSTTKEDPSPDSDLTKRSEPKHPFKDSPPTQSRKRSNVGTLSAGEFPRKTRQARRTTRSMTKKRPTVHRTSIKAGRKAM
jgi:hypothetical protein